MKYEPQYAVFFRHNLELTTNLGVVKKAAEQLRVILSSTEIRKAIADAHQFGASSHAIQKAISSKILELGFTTEKKGLFANFKVAGIRPDFYRPVSGGGILFEVERGKTIANNMDLLDVWKTHICPDARHLFLMVPILRVTAKGSKQKIFLSVENRVGAFFAEKVKDIDVDSVHIFGY